MRFVRFRHIVIVSTHSRPKAAAGGDAVRINGSLFQHTAARRRLHSLIRSMSEQDEFQHTAARRRLRAFGFLNKVHDVFQHTAARRRLRLRSA